MFLVTRDAQGFSSYTISPLLEVSSPRGFQFRVSRTTITEAFPSVTGTSTPITPGKQRLGVYLRGVCGLELLAPDLEVGRD